jgi:predicted SprT family Zn-dependent metalloprotease
MTIQGVQDLEVPAHPLSEMQYVPFKANKIDAVAASDRLVNTIVGRHAAAATDWDYANLRADIAIWEGRFNKECFNGELPPAAISFESDDIRRLGSYLLCRDGLALNWRINLNTKHLATCSQADLLETLLHEQIHQWEHIHGRTKGGRYHTKAFRDKAAEIGIPTHWKGYSLGPTPGGRFLQLLEKYGVHLQVPTVAESRIAHKQPRSTISPWACSCTRVWVARQTALNAICENCGNRFARAESTISHSP